MISEQEIREQTREILSLYEGERRNLIAALQEAQARFGYLPREAIREIGRFMRISEISVYGVATFYNQFRLVPPGKHPIKVCLGTACHMKGSNLILDAWERELGIKVGEITEDHEVSLERVACVGCCAMAPVTVVDETVHGRVTPTRVDGILLSFKLQKEGNTSEH